MVGLRSSSPRVVYGSLVVGATIFLITFTLQFKSWKIQDGTPRAPQLSSEPPPPVQPIWLIATISPATSFDRRNVIRSTWQQYLSDLPVETRFVISNPGELWLPMVEDENRTHGDVIMLDHLEENAKVANTVKTIEFFKYLVAQAPHTPGINITDNENTEGNSPYLFVSKLDDDSYIVPRLFYNTFLRPRLHARGGLHSTMIARQLPIRIPGIVCPGGQFYTLTYDLVETIVAQWAKTPDKTISEDRLTGQLLAQAKAQFDFVELDHDRALDVGREGQPGPGTVNAHKMKDDEEYLRVASLFDEDGFREVRLVDGGDKHEGDEGMEAGTDLEFDLG